MNVARSYWEGNAYTLNSGDKAGSDLDINLSDSSVWKGKVSGAGDASVSLQNGSVWNVTGSSTVDALAVKTVRLISRRLQSILARLLLKTAL